MKEKKESKRKFYEQTQFNIAMGFMLLLFFWLIAFAFFGAASIGFFYIIILFYVASVALGVVSAIHVQMIILPKLGSVKLEDSPPFFYTIIICFCLFTITSVLLLLH